MLANYLARTEDASERPLVSRLFFRQRRQKPYRYGVDVPRQAAGDFRVYGIASVLIRLGTSPTGISASFFKVCVSNADMDLVAEFET